MTHKPVLIAGFSGRALAQSARRAGMTPYVLDAYGDEDTAQAAEHLISTPEIVQSGFRSKPTLAALNDLRERCGETEAPLVLGAGFEASPKLIATLEAEFNTVGSRATTVETVKDPNSFFGTLKDLGIPHPETLTTSQSDTLSTGKTWLIKRIGGMGGLHIHYYQPGSPLPTRRYIQEHVSGLSISATAIATQTHHAFAFTQSWINPSNNVPFRFGGVVGSVSPDTELESRLIDTMIALLKQFDLRGLMSFDFIIADGEAFLLEINPRPTAALDVLDDETGTLFKAHLAAGTNDGAVAMQLLQADWRPKTKAAAYLYADAGSLTVPQVAWPPWVHDRPRKGNAIAHHNPILTVTAQGDTPTAAAKITQQRLEHMAYVVYDSEKKGG